MLKPTGKITTVKSLDNNYSEIILEDVPVYLHEKSGEELITLADVIRAEERRIAKKYNINEYNIFEIALLYADVNQKRNSIRQKFRFNKMLFYICKKLEEEYGEDVIIFDEMGSARSGPIPINLGNDIKELQNKEIIDIFIVKDGKKIPGSKANWEKIKSKGSIECSLTKKGEKLAKKLWADLDLETKEIILEVKKKLFYLDTELLKEKVHHEYPEYKMNYIENDIETFEEFLISA